MSGATLALGAMALLLASTTADAGTFKILQDQSSMEVTITGRLTDADLLTVVYDGQPLEGSDTQASGASGGAFSFGEDDNTWLGTADADYTALGLFTGNTHMEVAFKEPISGEFTEPGGVLIMTFDLGRFARGSRSMWDPWSFSPPERAPGGLSERPVSLFRCTGGEFRAADARRSL